MKCYQAMHLWSGNFICSLCFNKKGLKQCEEKWNTFNFRIKSLDSLNSCFWQIFKFKQVKILLHYFFCIISSILSRDTDFINLYKNQYKKSNQKQGKLT